jgi:hypothetical protein
MAENLSEKVRAYVKLIQGRTIDISKLRGELKIDPSSPAWEGLRVIIHRLVDEHILKPSGKQDGIYKVITQVQPVRVFLPGRERRPIFNLTFPRDFEKGIQMDFAEHIIVREGDLITLGGVKSKGKTTICLSFCAENIERNPVLMGNEYTVMVEGVYEPAPRFLNRLDKMSEWVKWTDENGMDKFTLLPIRDDYAEHIVKDRINIIDWINLDASELYDIGKVLEDIKANLGRGVAIVALQKGETAEGARGGQFVRDFSDVELLLDSYGDNSDDILLTVKGVKEKTAPILGKTYSYSIVDSGTKIYNFREVIKCPECYGKGWKKQGVLNIPCPRCHKSGWIDK